MNVTSFYLLYMYDVGHVPISFVMAYYLNLRDMVDLFINTPVLCKFLLKW